MFKYHTWAVQTSIDHQTSFARHLNVDASTCIFSIYFHIISGFLIILILKNLSNMLP